MNRFLLKSLLLLGLAVLATPGVVLACSGSCSSDTDCAANPCRYCDTDFGVCSDCCEFTEQITCPTSACFWQYGECRNISGTTCGLALPETPSSYRYLFFIGITALILSLAMWRVARKRRRTR